MKDAYAHHRLACQEEAKQPAVGSDTLVLKVVAAYLKHAQTINRKSTFDKRGTFLFDFCYGLGSKFWDFGIGRIVPVPKVEDYLHLHAGYGKTEVSKLIPMDIQNWLDIHPGWATTCVRRQNDGSPIGPTTATARSPARP